MKETTEICEDVDGHALVYRCKHCSHKLFHTEARLRNHIEKNHNQEVLAYSCALCSAHSSTIQCFTVHLETCHPNCKIPTDQFSSRLKLVAKDKVTNTFYAYGPQTVVCVSSNGSGGALIGDDSLEQTESTPSVSSDHEVKHERAETPEETEVVQEGEESAESSEGAETRGIIQEDRKDLMESLVPFTSSLLMNPPNIPEPGDSPIATSDSLTQSQDPGPSRVSKGVPWHAMSLTTRKRGQTCVICGQRLKNWCMYTLHMLEHKRAYNPYKCLAQGCLESYSERKKLITHVNYKHPTVLEVELEAMLLNGDSGKDLLNDSASTEGLLTETRSTSGFETDPNVMAVMASLAKHSERSQNLRALRANRRLRMTAMKDPSAPNDGAEEAMSAPLKLNSETMSDSLLSSVDLFMNNSVSSTSGKNDSSFNSAECQSPSVSVTVRSIAPLNLIPHSLDSPESFTIPSPLDDMQPDSMQAGLDTSLDSSAVSTSDTNGRTRKRLPTGIPTKKPHWKTKMTVRELLGKSGRSGLDDPFI